MQDNGFKYTASVAYNTNYYYFYLYQTHTCHLFYGCFPGELVLASLRLDFILVLVPLVLWHWLGRQEER